MVVKRKRWRHEEILPLNEREFREFLLKNTTQTLTLIQKNSCDEESPTYNPQISEVLLVLVGGQTPIV